ncbi:hypothetical protein NWUPM3A1_93 [Escherichia phage vB_EcoM_3A1_SA_NWU]|uniref:Uncharacterized protein n=12 Tax=Phapecoctavirus TaxID=2733124 RepID=A0A6B9WYM9_9CAUD|nr:hypothetical protein [Escherichia coli]YP_009786559.1 hypothetical protein HOR21_gp097 [Escherichia phage ESCO13]YP_009787087.1 hypothetical protein HOR27_gp096 [Escherichia phage ESCO5]YP_009823761.1 hypothetical protein HOV53_gp095 [Escherichia phage vB_EcoM_Schickermooser]YP_009984949.1 hypothetical protein JR319_gp233 [Escherichia phage vB_EcoM-Ro121c4YLVW]YP_009985543.1 hypothetical protein JR321_gp200 [Escherichia phage anhysbys]YP_009985899.1 hypothetical protein JR323_gp232 [Escher
MSLVNTTTWATVSMSTVMSTPIWKLESNKHNGNIPHEKQNAVIRASLVMLGMAEDSHYSVERNVNIRSNNDKRVVFANTTLFTFPVSPNCGFKRIYQENDIFHFGDEEFTGWGASHIKMDDFGNSYDPAKADDTNQ